MASSASTRLRFEKQARGENRNSWGDTRLNEALSRLEEAIADTTVVALGSATTYDLTSGVKTQDYVADESRAAVLQVTGTPASTVAITTPNTEKLYLVDNQTAQSLTFTRAGGGTAATVRANVKAWLYCDGSAWRANDPTLDQVKTPAADVAMGGYKLTGLGTPTNTTDAASKTYVDTADTTLRNYIDAALATAYAPASYAQLLSPTFLGDPKAPTPSPGDNDTSIATTAFVADAVTTAVAAAKVSPTFTGDPKAPTPTAGDNDTSIATTAFVNTAVAANPVGLIFLSTQTVGSAVASVDITSGLNSTYDEYEIHLVGVTSASGGALWIRTSTNSGSSYDSGASDYLYGYMTYTNSTGATPSGVGSSGDTKIVCATTVGSSIGLSGVIRITNPSVAQKGQIGFSTSGYSGSGTFAHVGHGYRDAASAVNAIRFLASTGNISAGSFRLYGVRKS